MTSCPNCGASVEPTARLCPDCGAELQTVWPPPLSPPIASPSPLRPKVLTDRVWTDFLLGAAVQYLTHLATARVLVRYPGPVSQDPLAQYFAPGFFVLAELFWAFVFGALGYYSLRQLYPVVARGSGYMTLALLVILLGALFTCHTVRY